MVTRRADTLEMSSRSTVSIWVGMSTRKQAAAVGPHFHLELGGAAADVQRPASRGNHAPRHLDRFVGHVVDRVTDRAS